MCVGLLASHTQGADLIVKRISYSEGVILFADKAILRPRVELILKNGRTVRGKLVHASSDRFSFASMPPAGTCDVHSVRMLGVTARPSRIARGMVFGVLGGLMLSGMFITGVDTVSESLVLPTMVGLPFLGGWTGAKVAEHGQDMLYVLHSEGPGSLCAGTK